jgi:hypothetical protein
MGKILTSLLIGWMTESMLHNVHASGFHIYSASKILHYSYRIRNSILLWVSSFQFTFTQPVPLNSLNFTLNNCQPAPFLSSSYFHIVSAVHPVRYPIGTMTYFRGIRRSEREYEHWPLCSADEKSAWSYASITPHVFESQCLIKCRVNPKPNSWAERSHLFRCSQLLIQYDLRNVS